MQFYLQESDDEMVMLMLHLLHMGVQALYLM